MKWFIKTASLLTMAAAMFVSCGEKEGPDGGSSVNVPDLAISFDKNVIKNDGKDAVTLKAYYKGDDVSSEATFWQIIPGKLVPQQMDSRTFTSTTLGAYKFKVTYQTSSSAEITVNVTDKDIPAAVADAQPDNTSFVHRAFFNQYTGAGCGYCPYMVRLLRETLTGEVADKVVLASLRTYAGENGFAVVPNPSTGYPFLHIDCKDSYDYNLPSAGLVSKINAIAETPAKVGISASPVYYEDEKKIIVRVAVKAAEKGEYNVGLWLMQDDYYKVQTDYDNIGDKTYNYHQNCVRVADSNYMGYHSGYPLGTLEVGQTGEWIFMIDVNDDPKTGWWAGLSGGVNLDKLHFAAFVTTFKGSKYEVVNAIDFPYNQPAPFDYK